MPYLPTAQAYLEQSRLLISARPTTTRISTKYNLPNPSPNPSKYKPTSKSKANPKAQTSSVPSTSSPAPETTQSQPQPLKATLTLKTYDPVSGVCLKYQTDKGAEVGRLVAALGNCGRVMAALPDKEEASLDAEEGVKEGMEEKALEGTAKVPVKEGSKDMKSGQGKGGEKGGGGGGGGGKKKKGKR